MCLVAILQRERSWIPTHTHLLTEHSSHEQKCGQENHEPGEEELHLAAAFGFTLPELQVGC